MHIVHVITRLLQGGSEENTIATCRWQVAAGHRVSLIHGIEYATVWNGLSEEGISVIALPELVHAVHPVRDAAALLQLRQLYRALRPDVIHTHQSKAGILGRLASIAEPKAAVVHGIHIVPFVGVGVARRQGYVTAEKLAARRTDLFIGVSKAVGRAYVDSGIARQDQVQCVRSGMDIGKFLHPQPPSDSAKLVGGAERVVLMMAAFESRKRHVAFLKAFAQAGGAQENIRILLAGQGPCEDAVREAVNSLGLEDRVVFCGHRSDPEALFAIADVSVLTSEREGLPRVAVQSIAAGVPVLSTNLPGLDELITHDLNGRVFGPTDMPRFAEDLICLLHSPQVFGKLRAGARSSDISDWQLEALGRRTTDLCQIALDAKSRQKLRAVA